MYRSRLYRKAPRSLQELALDARWLADRSVRSLVGGERLLAEVMETQWLDSNRLRDWQWQRLDRVIRAAGAGCPYYQQLFAGLGIRGAEDLGRIPILRKEDVRRHFDALRNRHHRGPTVTGSTSGTSGSPLVVRKSLDDIAYETAFYRRQLAWAGYQPGDRLAWLRGDTIVDPGAGTGPFWRQSRLGRTLYLSSYHLGPATAAGYIAALADYQPAIIQAYPSSITFLARHLADRNATYPARLKAIVTSSETLAPDDQQLIEERFNARVFDWYGSYERVAAIGTCERGRHHLLSDYSYGELAGDGPEYTLIGTSLHNLAMPLIRYDSGDLVTRSTVERCECGRSFPVIERILGRQDDDVLTPTGRRIGRLDHIFKGVSGILEAQIIQEAHDRLDIEVVATGGFTEDQRQLLRSRALALTGGELAVRVIDRDRIDRGPRGKHQLVVSRLGRRPRP